jgi:hypothetical protein
MNAKDFQKILNNTTYKTNEGYFLRFLDGYLYKGSEGSHPYASYATSPIGEYRLFDTVPPIEGVFGVEYFNMKEDLRITHMSNVILKYKIGMHVAAVILNFHPGYTNTETLTDLNIHSVT